MTQEQIEKLQGNYKPFIGDILEPKQVSDSYKAARHIQSAQKITTNIARVTLDLPNDGIIILTVEEYNRLREYGKVENMDRTLRGRFGFTKIIEGLRDMEIREPDLFELKQAYNTGKVITMRISPIDKVQLQVTQ